MLEGLKKRLQAWLEKGEAERHARQAKAIRDEERRLEANLLRAQAAIRRNDERYACRLTDMND